jgi:ribosome biogenesis GTPase
MLLDRFLVLVEANEITPIICITKSDLLKDEEKERLETHIHDYRSIGYQVLLSSSKSSIGIEPILDNLKGKTSVFAGQSGVGKSSLLNVLNPELSIKTDNISAHLGRGKHTTRHVELIEIANGDGLVADTPGFSALDFDELEAAHLSNCFPEIEIRKSDCKFRGCLHVNEPKCAIKSAVEKEEITEYRYQHYLQFLQEIKDRKPRY